MPRGTPKTMPDDPHDGRLHGHRHGRTGLGEPERFQEGEVPPPAPHRSRRASARGLRRPPAGETVGQQRWRRTGRAVVRDLRRQEHRQNTMTVSPAPRRSGPTRTPWRPTAAMRFDVSRSRPALRPARIRTKTNSGPLSVGRAPSAFRQGDRLVPRSPRARLSPSTGDRLRRSRTRSPAWWPSRRRAAPSGERRTGSSSGSRSCTITVPPTWSWSSCERGGAEDDLVARLEGVPGQDGRGYRRHGTLEDDRDGLAVDLGVMIVAPDQPATRNPG